MKTFQNEMITKHILEATYITLFLNGYDTISLRKKDLLSYVPKLEERLEEYGITYNDIFVKTPISETYDQYRVFLLDTIIRKKLGYLNADYSEVKFNCTEYYAKLQQKQMFHYKDIIEDCTKIILTYGYGLTEEEMPEIEFTVPENQKKR